MNLSYYVYYKVPPGNSEGARVAVGALQRDLAQATGIAGRLLHRRDDPTTWMEIYENVPDPARFEAKLGELAERHRVSALLVPGSSRKQEVFRSF
jgi:hypothetical protein